MSAFKPARTLPEHEVRARLRDAQPSAAIFVHLAESSNPEARAEVAAHPYLFIPGRHDIVHRLAHDPSAQVRGALAQNPHLTPAIAMQLADDPDWHIRCMIAGRPDTSPAILSRLARDRDVLVRVLVAEQRHRLPAEARARLAHDPQPEVREAVSVARLSRRAQPYQR